MTEWYESARQHSKRAGEDQRLRATPTEHISASQKPYPSLNTLEFKQTKSNHQPQNSHVTDRSNTVVAPEKSNKPQKL